MPTNVSWCPKCDTYNLVLVGYGHEQCFYDDCDYELDYFGDEDTNHNV